VESDSQASFGYLFQFVREYVVDLRELDLSHTPIIVIEQSSPWLKKHIKRGIYDEIKEHFGNKNQKSLKRNSISQLSCFGSYNCHGFRFDE
jgi:hypothetical protein